MGDKDIEVKEEENNLVKLERRPSSSQELFRSLSKRKGSLISNPPELENSLGWKVSLCKFIHARPGKFCMSCCCLLFFMTVVGLGAFPFLQGESDISNPSDPANVAFDGIRLAREDFDVNFEDDLTFESTVMQFGYVWENSKLDDTEIINAANLQSMCEFEQILFQQFNPTFEECDPETTEDVCITTDGSFSGRETLSIAELFYLRLDENFSYSDCFLLEEEDVEQAVDEFYVELNSSPENELRLGFFVNSNELSTVVRSLVQVGTPSEDETLDVLFDIEADIFEFCDSTNTFFRSVYRQKCQTGDVRVLIFILELLEEEFNRLILADATWIIMSFIFVGCWMIFYTKSKFLTMCFMSYIFAIVTSSIFIYKAILQILYFDFLQILAIFLIIGIGADANFVILDAWKQSREIFSKSKAEVDDSTVELRRLIYAHTRGTKTIFNTSLTTFSAFMFTAITPLVSISAFGIFAALCVMMVYIFSLTMVPATILVYHRRWGYKVEEQLESKLEENAAVNNEQQLSGWDKFIENAYVPFLLKYHIPVVICTVILGILGLTGTTQIEELTEQENFLPDDHMLQEFINVGVFVGGADEEFSRITFSFGIKGVERDIISRYAGDPDEYKENVIYDTDFQLDIDTINAIVKTCDDIVLEECRGEICNGVSLLVTPEDGEYLHICPLKNFSEFHETEFGSSLIESDGSFDGEISPQLIATRLAQFLDAALDLNFYSAFGLDRENQRVRFVTTEFRIVASPFQPGPQVRETRDQLKDFVSRSEENYGLRNVKFSADIFITEASGRALLNNAIRGLAITVPVVYLILMTATNNFLLATFGVLTISFIIMSVMGVIAVPLGYQLGLSESIVVIMIVGLSVDYSVHLLHMMQYAGESEGVETRELRFAYSAKTIAKTVVAGGLTTLGAGIFLLGTQIVFFFKMGIMLSLTIFFSLVYSLLFLMGMEILCGPEGENFNMDKLFAKCRNKEGSD
eukprot:snap_masked-scaffold_83-processed-gene-0.18-mRNA-1 protein AED:1.00 eAED:1.00 QI:0/-1/0/0/-1/1/1/0/977